MTGVARVHEDAPLNKFHKRLACYAGGGPFLDGYVLSIIGVALVQATPQLRLSASWQGLIGASALIGIFFGGFIGGWLTDKFGRQVLYTLDLIVIIVCSVAQFWVHGALSLFLWRLLIGVAVGADYPIATSLLAEFTPKRYRGPLLGGLVAIWFVGAAVAYVVGEFLLHSSPDAWRWMLASAALPATAFVIMRHGTPESPLWLMQKGRHAEAAVVIRRVYGENVTLPSLAEPGADEKIGVKALFHSGYGARLFFVTAFWTCSIIPLFAIYAFGPKILAMLGLTGSMGNFGSAFVTLLFLVGSIFGLVMVNRLGRRVLLLHSFLWSGVALLLLGLFPDSSPLVILALFSAFALFIGGVSVLQWIYPNELFPTQIRGTAVGLASSLSRIGAAIGTYLVPVALDTLGTGITMLIAAGITLAGFAVSLWGAPETTGMGLEQSAAL
jgi:putative MFS transporter